MSPLQAWRNGSVPHYTLSHKKKLWNSLELSNTLVVENVTVNQSGTYNCTASSGQMVLTSSATVVVYGRVPYMDSSLWLKSVVKDYLLVGIPEPDTVCLDRSR